MSMKPKPIIYAYWAQGVSAASTCAKNCWDLWAKSNPDYDLRVLDAVSAVEYLPDFGFDFNILPYQAQADIVRVEMLALTGGVWVDAGVVPLVPLRVWLPERMPSGFFIFHDPRRGRVVENWFIASQKDHPLILGWRDAIRAYWRQPRRKQIWRRELNPGVRGDIQRLLRKRLQNTPIVMRAEAKPKQIFEPKRPIWAVHQDGGGASAVHPYFWPHYVFEAMLAEDASLAEHWEQVPRYSSYDSLMLRHSRNRYANMTEQEMYSLVSGSVMQKLYLNKALPPQIEDALFAVAEAKIERALA